MSVCCCDIITVELVSLGAQWGPWSPWSECSATCGTDGRRQKTRTCPVNGTCGVGDTWHAELCNNVPCSGTIACIEIIVQYEGLLNKHEIIKRIVKDNGHFHCVS